MIVKMEEQDFSKLVNNLKNILNNTSSANESSSSNNKLNITPEMINTIANSIKNSSSENINSNNSQVDSQYNQNQKENSSANNTQTNNFDLVTMLKIKSIMETLNNKDDAKSRLLYSLKPYLRTSRQQKIDQYVNLLKLTSLTDLFKSEK